MYFLKCMISFLSFGSITYLTVFMIQRKKQKHFSLRCKKYNWEIEWYIENYICVYFLIIIIRIICKSKFFSTTKRHDFMGQDQPLLAIYRYGYEIFVIPPIWKKGLGIFFVGVPAERSKCDRLLTCYGRNKRWTIFRNCTMSQTFILANTTREYLG